MIVGWMRPGKLGDCIRCDRTLILTNCRQYFHSRRTNLTCMKPNTMWLTTCANACLLCCGASLFFLQCMIVHVTEGIPLGGCSMSLFLHNRNGVNACLFSPIGAGMAEMHVLWVFVPQCLWGKGATATNAVGPESSWPRIETPWPRPLFYCNSGPQSPIPTTPTPTPTTPTLPPPRRRCVSVRKKCELSYWEFVSFHSYHFLIVSH